MQPLKMLLLADLPAPQTTEWLWHGLLAPGCLTMLTSQWKSGKSTLLALLLAKMQTGEPLAGLPVREGAALIISEEPQLLWLQRTHKLGLHKHQLISRPFDCVPDREQWRQLLNYVADLHGQHGFRLLAIDPLIMFFPSHTESDAVGAATALAELRTLADLGMAVLVLHHPKKGDTRDGQAARGIGVLNAEVDIVLEMTYFSSALSPDRRRQIAAYSRFDETPRRLLLELNAAGTNYAALPPQAAGEHDLTLLELVRIAGPATAAALRTAWPDPYARPDVTTLRRRLAHLVDQGLLAQHGTGRKNDPYRYSAKDAEE